MAEPGVFENITFVSPTSKLEVSAGDGDDFVVVTQLDSLFDADVIVNVDDGDDAVDASTYNKPISISGGDGDGRSEGRTGQRLDRWW